MLAEATDEWLADAFDRVYDVARAVPGRQLAASAADAATVAAPSVTVPRPAPSLSADLSR